MTNVYNSINTFDFCEKHENYFKNTDFQEETREFHLYYHSVAIDTRLEITDHRNTKK